MLSAFNRKQVYSADGALGTIHRPCQNHKLVTHLGPHNHYVVHGLTSIISRIGGSNYENTSDSRI